MCEVPRPRWRQAWRPARIALLVVATGCLVVGVVWHTRLGVVALAVGATLVFAAVLFPLVSEVEFGFPVGIKVKAGAREREHRMRKTFEDHRGDVELCAHLLCSPPEAAAALVEAAWARTAGAWRGAVTPELRAYVLCELVQLAGAHERWVSGPAEDSPASPLARLTPAPASRRRPARFRRRACGSDRHDDRARSRRSPATCGSRPARWQRHESGAARPTGGRRHRGGHHEARRRRLGRVRRNAGVPATAVSATRPRSA